MNSLLTIISQKKTVQPLFNDYLRAIYQELIIQVLNCEWPQNEIQVPTRMTDLHPECFYNGSVFDQQQTAVCVDIARAGMIPAQVAFDLINKTVNPNGVRQDHIFASRMTNQNEEVTHTAVSDSKIGGGVDQAIVLLPDPMGATGNSLAKVIDHYKHNVEGTAKKYISLHLIITPEFVRHMTTHHPDVIIYAARLDRGFSSEAALNKKPGELWDEEKGLNEKHYIVPGAGGVGELINNSFV